jgi:hypothetical protein
MLRGYGRNGKHYLYQLIKRDAGNVVRPWQLYKLVNNEDEDIDRDSGNYDEIYKSIHKLISAEVDDDGVADTYNIKINKIDPVCKKYIASQNYNDWENKYKYCEISFEVVPVSSGGRRRSSKKRPTARRRRSSKARKARNVRKVRTTRRR